MEVDVCALCLEVIKTEESSQSLTEKGIITLKKANESRLDDPKTFEIGQKVHTSCRLKYTHKREIRKFLEKKVVQSGPSNVEDMCLRSSKTPFSFETDCFFCCKSLLLTKSTEFHSIETV